MKKIETLLWKFITDHGLDNGNAEVVTEGDSYYAIAEACNHSTITLEFKDKEGEITSEDIIDEFIKVSSRFDPDEEFDELWSRNFAAHNGFRPSQFITMLTEDGQQFKRLAMKLQRQKSIKEKIEDAIRNQASVCSSEKNPKMLYFRGIAFDEYVKDEDGHCWSYICADCARELDIPDELLSDDGSNAVCGAEGCFNSGYEEKEDARIFYIDFPDSETEIR